MNKSIFKNSFIHLNLLNKNERYLSFDEGECNNEIKIK
jgi:hypothetical protein